MTTYVVGLDIDNTNGLELTVESSKTVFDSTVIIALDGRSNGKLYEYYNSVQTLITNRNRVILLTIAGESRIRKQISMLMASYGKYDIYSIDSIETVDYEYIDTLVNRKPTLHEVQQFIGADVDAYARLNSILLELSKTISDNDIEQLRAIIEENRDTLEDSVDVLNYLKSIVDSLNSGESDREINQARAELEAKTQQLKEAQAEVRKLEAEIDRDKDNTELLRKEAFSAKQRASELEAQINNSGPVIKEYMELNTALYPCRAKSIVYFKEISPVRFVPSLISKMMEILARVKKLKCKLMVYDNQNAFLGIYKPISIIDSTTFLSNRQSVINQMEKIVVVEPNPAIMEDTLKADYDVIIVFDRLRQRNDIVSGNNVYKYWVINSRNDLLALSSQFKIDKRHTISRPGVFSEGISIAEIADYSTKTNSAKLADYMGLAMDVKDSKDKKVKIIDLIFDRTNIAKIDGRK